MLLRLVRVFLFIFVVACEVQPQQRAAGVLPVTIAATEVTARVTGVSGDPRVVARKDFSLRQAYNDLSRILATENACSEFYGGSAVAISVLNRLISDVERGELPEFVSFQMTGRPRYLIDLRSGASFRLFEKAIVNSEGAFYQRRFDPMQRRPRNVGSFAPGTRPARALILMHELGHLIRGRNGEWLLPDDGSDSWQSKQNTARVERACRAQLVKLN